MISLFHYIGLSGILFMIGIFGILFNWRNSIKILMSLELILLSIMVNFVAFSHLHQNITGQVFSLFILTVAAAEAAIGLAIILIYFRNRQSINPEEQTVLKG
jgi:NADH-quinone oxidoreductase subunit K